VGQGKTLREVIDLGTYELVLSSSDIPAPPNPGQCSRDWPCHTFKTEIELVKQRFVNLSVGLQDERKTTILLEGFFNGDRLEAVDSEGCIYEGDFKPVVIAGNNVGVYKTVGPENGGEGVIAHGCSDPERIGNYNTFFISYHRVFAQVFFSRSTLNPTKPGSYIVFGGGTFDIN